MANPDEATQIHNLQKHIGDFCDARDWTQFHGTKDLAIAICTEASELLDIFRFKTPEQIEGLLKDQTRRKHIEEEVADVFYFLLRFCQMNDINLENALVEKMKINEEKYPASVVKGSNLKYTER